MSEDWTSIAAKLTSMLGLAVPPVAISFVDRVSADARPPAGRALALASAERADPSPSSCVFWTRALDTSFATSTEDHASCSVGRFVHGFAGLD